MIRQAYLLMVVSAGDLSGCEAMAPFVEVASGDRKARGSHCINIKMQCRTENDSEWRDNENMRRCSCRDYLASGVPKL